MLRQGRLSASTSRVTECLPNTNIDEVGLRSSLAHDFAEKSIYQGHSLTCRFSCICNLAWAAFDKGASRVRCARCRKPALLASDAPLPSILHNSYFMLALITASVLLITASALLPCTILTILVTFQQLHCHLSYTKAISCLRWSLLVFYLHV